ncbi:MAG: putative bifunctional diguanylate cyclase/phosphodiesterase, partial [Methyloligellaceae bacterium]
DISLIITIGALGSLLVAGTYVLLMQSVEHLVRKDAENAAQSWTRLLLTKVDDIDKIVVGEKASESTAEFIRGARPIGNVFRFKLFDREGNLRLASGEPEPSSESGSAHSIQDARAAEVFASGRVRTIVKKGRQPGQPALYAETYLPLLINGRTPAIFGISVDQSGKHQLFRNTSMIPAIGIAALMAIAFVMPASAFFFRTRQVKRADAELAEQNKRLNAVLDNMSQGLCMFDRDQRLVISNRPYSSLYGISQEFMKPGRTLREVLEHRVANGAFSGDSPEEYIHERLKSVANRVYSRDICEFKNGQTIALTHQPLPDGGWLASHDDITEFRRIESQLAHMAHHDTLTGLPNRVLLRKRIEEAVCKAHCGEDIAILCLDLDDFKSVNDTLGHPVGDALLKAASERLKRCVGMTDTVARLGGDEFAIVWNSADRPEDVSAFASRICDVFGEPFDFDQHRLSVGVTIGIAMAPNDGTDPYQLIKNADMALHRGKREGRGIFRFFEPEMDSQIKKRRKLEIDLRTAIENSAFELYYQPLFNAKTDEISCFEALLRWNHPARGHVPPDEFIPFAEETGLIVPLGEWVIKQACREAVRWPAHIKIAVNLSAVQIKSGNLVSTVTGALKESGMAADRLELEITETALMQDNEATLIKLHQLRDLGVRIAMDDFGTGYSSLSYLRSFPFDKIKIDRSFIKDLSNGEDARAIIRAVASLGTSLGMSTTAEGVETEEQLASVRAVGYTEIQGFLYSPPRSAEDITETYFKSGKLLQTGT